MSQNEFPELPVAQTRNKSDEKWKTAGSSKKLYAKASAAPSAGNSATSKQTTEKAMLDMKSISESLQLDTLEALPRQKVHQRAKMTNNPTNSSPGPVKEVSVPKEPVESESSAFIKNFLEQVQKIDLEPPKTNNNGAKMSNGTLVQLALSAPPGLSVQTTLPAPPGLFSKPAPPPGFAAQSAPTAEAEKPYLKPCGFDARNRQLMDKLQAELDRDQMERFKAASYAFRRLGQDGSSSPSSASEFYATVRAVLDERAFPAVFAELVCLLPDIRLQNELFECHRPGGGSGDVRRCDLCRQILGAADFRDHMARHLHQPAFAADFPPLC